MGGLRHPVRWFVRQLERMTTAVYYRWFFGGSSPFARQLGARVYTWERQRQKGDVPVERAIWEQQWEAGFWNYLQDLSELGRFSMMIGYLSELKPHASVLDIGCGEGLLFKRLRREHGGDRYLGIDVSASAVEKARAVDQDAFLCTDAEAYQPTDRYDVIVFNECLYYFFEPVETVQRYAGSLNQDGLVIVSTYVPSRRGRSILKTLKQRFRLVDETGISHGSKEWICSVFAAS